MSERKSHTPTRLSGLLEWVCREFNLQAGLKAYKVFDIWEEVVGTTIAKKAKPDTIRNRVLIVKVNSSPWIQELQFLKEQIREKLNARLGEKLIDDLFFQIGSVRESKEPPASQTSREWMQISLPQKELREMEDLLQRLHDPDLTAILKRILTNQKKRIRYFRGR